MVSEDPGASGNFRKGHWEDGSGRRHALTGIELSAEERTAHREDVPVAGTKMAEMRSTVALADLDVILARPNRERRCAEIQPAPTFPITSEYNILRRFTVKPARSQQLKELG